MVGISIRQAHQLSRHSRILSATNLLPASLRCTLSLVRIPLDLPPSLFFLRWSMKALRRSHTGTLRSFATLRPRALYSSSFLSFLLLPSGFSPITLGVHSSTRPPAL